jgi:hypothetical protein
MKSGVSAFAIALIVSNIVMAAASPVSAKDPPPVFADGLEGPAKSEIVSQNPAKKVVKNWEYLRVAEVFSDKNKAQGARYYLDFDGKLWGYGAGLDHLGSQGWELVQQVVFPGGVFSPLENLVRSEPNSSVYIFKREVPSE